MKKSTVIPILSIIAIISGILAKPVSKAVCACLIFGGLIILLLCISVAALNRMGKQCPACGQLIHVSVGQHSRVRSGMIPCPRCGAMVRVDHVTPR